MSSNSSVELWNQMGWINEIAKLSIYHLLFFSHLPFQLLPIYHQTIFFLFFSLQTTEWKSAESGRIIGECEKWRSDGSHSKWRRRIREKNSILANETRKENQNRHDWRKIHWVSTILAMKVQIPSKKHLFYKSVAPKWIKIQPLKRLHLKALKQHFSNQTDQVFVPF